MVGNFLPVAEMVIEHLFVHLLLVGVYDRRADLALEQAVDVPVHTSVAPLYQQRAIPAATQQHRMPRVLAIVVRRRDSKSMPAYRDSNSATLPA
jgi:hypothetical protein